MAGALTTPAPELRPRGPDSTPVAGNGLGEEPRVGPPVLNLLRVLALTVRVAAVPQLDSAPWTSGRTRRTIGPARPRPKVFGIGLSRTGGTSLSHALARLGLKAVHFPADADTRREIVTYLDRGASDPLQLTILRDHDSVSDTPVCCVYRGLDAAYSDAKFILTVRDEEAWLRSCEAYWTDFAKHPRRQGARAVLASRVRGSRTPFDRGVRALVATPLNRRFGRPIDHSAYTFAVEDHLYGDSSFDAARFAERRRSYELGVQRHFAARPEKLLVLDVCNGEGWEKLCAFLGLEAPKEPFPWTNDLATRHE